MKKLFNFCLATFAIVSVMSCNDDDDMNVIPQEPAASVGPNLMAYGLTEKQ